MTAVPLLQDSGAARWGTQGKSIWEVTNRNDKQTSEFEIEPPLNWFNYV